MTSPSTDNSLIVSPVGWISPGEYPSKGFFFIEHHVASPASIPAVRNSLRELVFFSILNLQLVYLFVTQFFNSSSVTFFFAPLLIFDISTSTNVPSCESIFTV